MTTSADTTYELTRNTIIEAALRKLHRLGKGVSADATALSTGMEALNALIAEYQTLGMHLWKRSEYGITLVASQQDYTIGVGQTINTAFPLKILGAWLQDSNGAAKQDLFQVARSEFDLLNDDATGKPVQFSYQPYINYGAISVWPKPDSTSASTYTMRIRYQKPFDGFTAAGETPDFPQEWQNALIYGLAVLLAPEYGIPLNDRTVLFKESEMHLQRALDGGAEETSLYFQIERRY